MADKQKVQVSIDAIDNFSATMQKFSDMIDKLDSNKNKLGGVMTSSNGVLDQLDNMERKIKRVGMLKPSVSNKEYVKQLKNLQAEIEKTINSLQDLYDKASKSPKVPKVKMSSLKDTYDISKMGHGKDIKEEIKRRGIDLAKEFPPINVDVSKKSLEDTKKKIRDTFKNNKVVNEVEVKTKVKNDVESEPKKAQKAKKKETVVTESIKASVNKQSVEKAKEEIQNQLNKNPVKAKVEVETVEQNVVSRAKSKQKSDVVIDEKASGKLPQVVLEGIIKKITMSKDAVESIAKTAINLVGSISKIDVNKDTLAKSITSVVKEINKTPHELKIGKDEKYFNKVIDKNIKNAQKNVILLNTKIDIKNIVNKLATLSKKKYSISVDINTSNVESKIIRLSTYINQLNSKDIRIKVDKSIDNIVKLSTYLNQLKSKDLSLDIDANISKAKSGIMAIYKMITELVKKKYKIEIDTSSLTGKNSQFKTTANTLKNIGDALKAIKSKKINIGINVGSGRNNISNVIRNIRSLNNLLQTTRNNISINVMFNDRNNALSQLRELSNLLRDIRRNSNINIRMGSSGSNSYSYGYGYSGNEPNAGNILTGWVQFLGRSSKGFGSFLEAIARVSQNMIRMGGLIGKLGVVTALVTAASATVAIEFDLAIKAVQTFGNMLLQVGSAIYKALKPGIDLYNQRTRAELALGAGARSMATIEGRQITDEESKSIGRQLTSKAIRDAAKSVFNPAELIDAMQGTVPMLYAKGMTAEQAYQTTKGVASVAKLGRLAPNQVLQETRDLAQGSITARTSQVANLLGITNADINKFKGDADALYDYLMEKFQEYSKALDEYAKTPMGAFEQLQETIAIAGDSIISKLAPPFVEVFHTITDSLGSFVDEQGHVLDENGQYLDEYGNKLDGIGEITYQVTEPLQNFVDALEEIIRYLIQAVDELVEYSGVATDSKTATEFFVDVVKLLIDALVASIKFLKLVAHAVMNVAKAIDVVAAPLLRFLLKLINLVEIARMGFENLFVSIQAIRGEISKEDAIAKIRENAAKGEKLIQQNEKDYDLGSGIQQVLRDFDIIQSKQDGALLEAYDRGKKRQEEEAKKRKSDTTDLDKVQGKETVDTKALEKANKEAIKQSQKELKARLAELRTLLADKLDELKDILEENELKYSQGFMTIDEYYSQKADIELQQAREQLEEARRERAEIENALYQNEEDRAKALAENDKKIKKYTRETAKAEKGIRELSRVFRDTTRMLGNFVNALNNGRLVNGKVVGGQKIDSESARVLSEKDPYTYIAIKTAEKINEQGGNVKAGWLLGQMRQEVGNLDEGSELSRTHNNYSGIKWYQGAIGSKGSMSPEGDYYQKFNTIDDYIAEKVKVYMQSNFRDASFNSSTAEEFVSNLYKGGWFEAGYNSYVQNVANGEKILEDRLRSLGLTLESLKAPVESFSNTIDENFSYFNPMTWAGEVNSGSSVSKQMAGVQQSVINAWNEVARKYFEATGEKIGINSFTGDLASGYNPHQAGEKGHQAGWKIDIDYVSNIKKLVELLNEVGAAIGDERTHLDVSFWGGTGGEQLGAYRTGELFHENASQYMQAISNSVGQAINGSAYLDKTAVEMFNEVKEFESKTAEIAASIMEGTFGYPMQKIQQLQMDYENEVRNITGKWVNSKFPEYKEAGLKRLEVLKKKYDLEVFNLTKNSTEQMFEYQLEELRREVERSSTNILLQRTNIGSSIAELIDDVDSKYGLGKLINEMEQARQTLMSLGHYVDAREIGDKLRQLKDLVLESIDGWIEQGRKYFDNAEAIFNVTSRFTPTQREFAEREFNAYRAQSDYEGYTAKGFELESQYKQQLKVYNDLIKKQKELTKGTEEYENSQKEITRALQDTTRTEALIAENEQMKKLADLQRKMPDYLDDIGKAARDALDNGLVEFLTDGILEAESLGDALRNLATGILKEIQQVSAKWVVKDLMNMLFGQFNIQEEMPYASYLTAINETLVTGFSSVVSAVTGKYVSNTGVAGTQQVGLGAFSKPWEYSELNPNRKTEDIFDVSKWKLLSDKIGKTSTHFDLLSNNANMFGDKLSLTSSALDTTKKVVEATTTASQVSEAMQQTENTAKQTLTVSDANLKVATDNATMSLNNLSVATGNTNIGTPLQTVNNPFASQSQFMQPFTQQLGGMSSYWTTPTISSMGFGGMSYPSGMGSSLFGTGSPMFGSYFGAQDGQSSLYNVDMIISAIYNVSDTIMTSATDIMSLFSSEISRIINSIEMAYSESSSMVEALVDEQVLHNSMSEEQLDESIQESYNIDQNTFAVGGLNTALFRLVGGLARTYVRSRNRKAKGGRITGAGTSTSDSIPAMLSNGEYVINAKSTKKYGNILDLINNGTFEIPKFADGGLVGDENVELDEVNINDNIQIINVLTEITSYLASILAYIKSIAERTGVSENEDGSLDGSNSEYDSEYTSYAKTHEFSKKSGSKVNSFLHWTGLGTDMEDNRLVDKLGDDVPKSTKMIVDLLQVIADNTYTLVNLVTIITALDFIRFIYNIITSGIRGLGMKDGGILKLAKGGTVYHNNGLVRGAGTSTSDSIPAMLSNGEAVLNAKAVKELGTNFITAVNNGNFAKIKASLPHFADGGFVGDAYQGTARGMTDFAKNVGANVTTNNQMNIALVRDETEAMAHFMRSPRGQRILVDFAKGNGRVFSRFNHSI